MTSQISNANLAKINPLVKISFTGVQTIDLTLRCGFWVFNRGTTPISNRVPLRTLAARINDVPQYGVQGLLLEEAATNVAWASNDFSNAAWNFTEVITPPERIAAPDGAFAGVRVQVSTTPGKSHQVALNNARMGTVAVNDVWTYSFYAKAGPEEKAIQVLTSTAGFANTIWANYDLVAGVIRNQGPGTFTASMVPAGNGWWRCSLTATATSAQVNSTTFAIVLLADNGSGPGRAPGHDLPSSVYLWGAQLEKQPFPTSLIATPTNANATRARDHLGLPSASLQTGPASYAMKFMWAPLVPGKQDRGIMIIGDGSNGPRAYAHPSGNMRVLMRRAGADQMFSTTYATLPGIVGFAQSWGGGDGIFSGNGDEPQIDGAVADPQSYAGTPISIPDSAARGLGSSLILTSFNVWANVKLIGPQLQEVSKP